MQGFIASISSNRRTDRRRHSRSTSYLQHCWLFYSCRNCSNLLGYQNWNLSSERRDASNILHTFNDVTTFKSSERYQASKLFVMVITQSLASVVNSTSNGVSVLAVCPGFCQSELSCGHQGIATSILRGLLNMLVLRTTEQGARTLVSGAALGPESHGKFWFDDELHQVSAPEFSGDDGKKLQHKIWDEIIWALKKDVHGLVDVPK